VTVEITTSEAPSPRGWVFYDGECRFCVRGATRWGGIFARRGFHWLPLQTPGTTARLGMEEAALREEMKLLRADGRISGGVDAWAILFRSAWWLWPIGALLALPGVRWLGAVGYRWVARNRYCLGGRCERSQHKTTDQDQNHPRHSAFFKMP
jgi:predicted DCC family thiol-disulfide oxidoreductase YuxK